MKTLTRRAFVGILALGVSLVLSGCYGKKEPEPAPPSEKVPEVEEAADETTSVLGRAVLGTMILNN